MLPVEPTEKEFTTKCTANLLNKNIPSIRYLSIGLHQPRKPIFVLLSVAGNQEEGLFLIHDSTSTSSVKRFVCFSNTCCSKGIRMQLM